ncbi:heterocycloanthracin/sonorensin family bacteriocin [Bacillus mobilis]|uniref:heterocycloanthracin/sonorensin family bacteriocin n=1 Tax=Bacillus mobilis TaxID=2026190 RepID=UPI002E1DE6B4|nr:heterocycloanthracin/sonorensin family bacteriocin [Bacillus mobilis]MED0932436.1 heterocycloanthracin/sonorensin family bacteriocin [Bacillus mobilis]MED0957648.1 heterocycloanthracin/sonorensin family bacteriocin [Bacillus mobilis]
MNQFQQDLQSLNLNDYQSGNVVYWDQLQQNQYPYFYIQDEARRCGGCGGRCGGCGGGRCGGCGGRCVGCAGCFGCFNCWNWWII